MPTRIDKLTSAQIARMPEFVSRWLEIGLSTKPADFEVATTAALRAYKLCNLKRPMVILRMGSPYGATLGGVIAWAMLREFAKRGQVRSQVRSQVWSQVESQVWSEVERRVGREVGRQVEREGEGEGGRGGEGGV